MGAAERDAVPRPAGEVPDRLSVERAAACRSRTARPCTPSGSAPMKTDEPLWCLAPRAASASRGRDRRADGRSCDRRASSDESSPLCAATARRRQSTCADDLRADLKRLTADRGVDVVYDPVGGALTETALRAMAWKGRLLVIGFASGEIPKTAAQPRLAQRLRHPRRLLGRIRHARTGSPSREHGRFDGLDEIRRSSAFIFTPPIRWKITGRRSRRSPSARC